MADANFRPALLVVDMQEDFCPPVSFTSIHPT
jgi:nicotinamidase-related amidase